MTSSSAILYPSFKGLEQSNSSFVQVSQPVREMSRNSPSNHRNSATKAESGNKTKSKSYDFVDRKEDCFVNRRRQSQHFSNDERRAGREKERNDHETSNERPSLSVRISNADPKPQLKLEKSQQYDIRESGMNADTSILEKEKTSENSEECTELSLTKPESFQDLLNPKHPKHTIIIHNTFINRPTTEQDEFLTQFSPTYYNKTLDVGSVRDIVPSVTERVCHNENEALTEIDGMSDRNMRQLKDCTDVEDDSNAVNELNNIRSTSIDKNVPIGAIVTAVLWIILITFWFLLYVKVLTVYNPLPKDVPKPEPTNYERCLMIFKKFGVFIGQLLNF